MTPRSCSSGVRHIRVLGWLWIIYSILVALVAVAVMIVLLEAGPERQPAGELLLVALLALPGVLGGVGLLQKRSYARVMVLLLGIISLVSFPPIGTIMGIYTIWVLLRKESIQILQKARSGPT